MASKQCKAKTKAGRRCTNNASDSGYCFTHDPARAKERSEARKRGGRNRANKKRSGSDVVQIETVDDVLTLVNAIIADTWEQENTGPRSRALLGAADMALKVLSVGELEARVAALEVLQSEKS